MADRLGVVGDGVRHAGVARRRRGVLHAHPPRARPRPPSSSPTWSGATTPSAAPRRWPSAPRRSAPGSRPPSTSGRPGRCRVVLGQKHAAAVHRGRRGRRSPTTASTRIVGLVLAPHFSRLSVGQYQDRLVAAARARASASPTIDSWHLEPDLPRLPRRTPCATRWPSLPERTKVLFTAHSLPERVLVDDPYPDQLRESAAAVAEAVGLDRWAGWSLALAVGRPHAGAVAGPDILEVIRDLAATGRADGVLVCPQGFVSDHLEVVYDLDIEAAAVADEVGLAFARTRVLNDDPAVLGALADRVLAVAP